MKTPFLFYAALLLAVIAIAWMGLSFAGSSYLGLGVVALIALVFAVGAMELLRFRRETLTLQSALDSAQAEQASVPALDRWLSGIPPRFHPAIRRRLDGELSPLPAPILTPYLTSLLVMLGLLGTFAGMVGTLHGAVEALQGSTQLEAIRAGLTAPIGGLSEAFGTSVAGVAASAMLGLMATLSRQERLSASRLLDQLIPKAFAGQSRRYQQDQTFEALREQGESLPETASALRDIGQELAQLGERLEKSLLERQESFQSHTQSAFTALADSVSQTLQERLTESHRLAAESLQQEMGRAWQQLNQQLLENNQTTLEAFQASTLEQTQNSHKQLLALAEQSKQQWQKETAQWLAQQTQQDTQRLSGWTQALQEQATQQQQQSETLLAKSAEIIGQAGDAPKAAAQAIHRLETEIGQHSQRENALLDERRDHLERLDRISGQLEARMAQSLTQMNESGNALQQSAHSLEGLGERFNESVLEYSQSNEQLRAVLTQVQEALSESATRSDEQLAYYIAQARELMDHSLIAQKAVFTEIDNLSQGKARGKNG